LKALTGFGFCSIEKWKIINLQLTRVCTVIAIENIQYFFEIILESGKLKNPEMHVLTKRKSNLPVFHLNFEHKISLR